MNIDSDILLQSYELADTINSSEELKLYKEYLELLDKDQEVLRLKKQLNKDQVLFEEAQRFGHFHPNYHEAKEKVEKTLNELEEKEVVKKFKQAETELDNLLYQVSKTIAQAVSKSIIVSKNDELLDSGASCGVGSCGSCGISGSCSI